MTYLVVASSLQRPLTTEITMKKILAVPLSCLLLSGCMQAVKSNFSIPENKTAAYKLHAKKVTEIQHWESRGLIGVRLKNKAESANFSWVQKGDNFSIELYGPLGLGATYLNGRPLDVTLTTHDKRKYHARTAQLLMDRVMGWSVPVLGLVSWARGIPMPSGAQTHTLNQYGFLAGLQQDGWKIRYISYQNVGIYGLPHQMILTRPGIRVTAVFNQWKVF